MKKLFTLILTGILIMGMLSGCGESTETPQTAQTTEPTQTQPTPTQTPEEEKKLKILVIGNSHSNDTFWLLQEVFKDQMPEQEVVLGAIYYSGCSVSKHVQFATQNKDVYDFHINNNGSWDTMEKVTMDMVLQNQVWDVVIYQGGRGDTEAEYNLVGRRALEQIVQNRVAQPYQQMWQITWPSPNDPMFFSPDYHVQPPAGWVEYLQSNFGHDPFKQFDVMTGKAKEYLLEDETYENVICVGSGIMYAHAVLDVPQTDLWRDYTHLSDYGRLIAAYCFYVQFTGNPVTEVNIDIIPAALRQKHARNDGDLIVTEEMKQVIMTAANHALEDPWTVPQK